jgi:predicted metal-binding protein
MTETDLVPRLHVCITCRGGRMLVTGETPPGAQLHAAVAARLGGATAPVRLAPVNCLANCERGCSAAISAAGKWTYLLGGLDPAQAADLLIYARSYAASANGTVMPSRRPVSLRNAVIARVPAPEALT